MPKAVSLKRKAGEPKPPKEKKKPRKKSKASTVKIKEPVEKIKLKPYPFVGELLFCGGTNWDLTGRWKLPKSAIRDGSKPPAGGRNLLGPHRLSALSGIRVRNVISGPHANHSIIITEEGQAMSWGRNEQEQLGLGHAERVDSPTIIDALKNKHIVNAACGRTHSLCLTDEGTVYAFGDNRLGQLGIGCQSASMGTPCKIDYHGSPIVQVACGGEFSMILDCKGSLHSFGCQEYSQLGHNSNGRFAVKGTKTSSQNITSPRKIVLEKLRDGTIKPLENVVMKDVVCGGNHTVAMDMQSRIFTWGFGGYGRLGHGEPRDEPVPRSIKFFEPQMSGRTASKIYTGSSYSIVVCTNGQLYFWGQTKSTGEATMYPKPIHDLSGWTIRSVGCSNSSIVIAAEESIISWGPSPTYGELGYGENVSKSSTQPQKAKPLEGFHVSKVACGMGHSLMITRDDTEEDKVRISKVPIFDPRVAHSIPGTPYIPKPPPVVEETKEGETGKPEVVTDKPEGAEESGNGTANPPSIESGDIKTEQPSTVAAKQDTGGNKPEPVETKPDTVGGKVDSTHTKPERVETKPTTVGVKPDSAPTKSELVETKPDTVGVVPDLPQTAPGSNESKPEVESRLDQGGTEPESVETKPSPVETEPGSEGMETDSTEMKREVIGADSSAVLPCSGEAGVTQHSVIRSTKEVVTTGPVPEAAGRETEPMDMSMPGKTPPVVANGVGAATELPPPSNEPLNLSMGSTKKAEQVLAVKNLLPPPPSMSPQQERTSCIKKVSRDGVIQPSSNGAVVP